MNWSGAIHLRGHHLCCLLTYVGKGPGVSFIGNLDRIAAEIGAGQKPVQIVRGADDICASGGFSSCPFFPRCERNMEMERRDNLMLSALSLMPGSGHWSIGSRRQLNEGMVWRFRQAARCGAFLDVCADCSYEDLCRCVAASGFAEARLFPPRPPNDKRQTQGDALCAM